MRSFEEQSETNREEKSESSGQEETESDGEEQEESDGEEHAKLDGEEQAESNGDEQVESDGEEQEESDGEEQLQPSSVSRDKTHSMASLLFVSGVLMHGDKKKANIDPKLLGLVDDLEMFNKFPWGTHSYEYTLKQLRKPLKEKVISVHEKAQTISTFTYLGFPLPLAILVYECIPAVANKYVELRDHINNSVPRICRWRTTWKCKKSPSYSGVVKALDDSKDIKSILSPIKWEKKMPHMQCFIRISESMSNNLIDILTAVLESGGTINWTDDTDRHERCGNVDVRNEEQQVVTNEEQPSGQATKVGNTIHVQPMSETTRDYLRVVTPGYSPIHMSTPSTMYGPEARQSEKVYWCTVKAYIDQQFSLMRSEISLMRSEILLLPSKIITSLQQQNIHVEGQLSPHCERQHTHVEDEHSPHSKKQHTHVEEQYTPYYEEQPLQDDVEGESHLVVRENPKRVPKCSHYLEPPYTDPFHYTKARRGDHIQFDLLRNIEEHEWLFSEHVDDALFGIRKQQHLGDCAVYTIKFIEFDMAGLSFESLSDDRMAFYIRKMAVDIFCQQWDP
ncbi:hypothetical protein F8388_020403 [Cannabis sativa]|uniref:DUF1985 domain-containing protein n=1 Tax=Cannabis sativa TaxID=3483 RepID=A0A7J6HIN6_CANSA|nr:hypothetical protein F8388_020403 [Cannabis sativa]